ncbi:MAG TPA: efflux RND transporter periplasmic adaptor subunit [Methylotenera sp.]|nr:efflux RND transporter periplasmic adaptor subunit [Methylotenera sp.]HPH04569.1 efflux RND transporter periplasmic adaptor subunit [Methylotenera sp.]HPN00756.1 efflux RND transporter periplasmic adaptor subunit [Methylotenera sp.]
MTKISLILCCTLLAACQKPAEPPLPPRPALVQIVGTSNANNSMVLVGEVKSRYETNLAFRIGGKIVERKVEVGSEVKKGQVIAKLDASDTNLNASAALADVRAAEANRELAKSEVERQRALVDKKFISQSSLDKYEAQLKTAEARLNQAKAQAAETNNLSRYTALVADRNGVVKQIQAEPGQVVAAGQIIAQVVDTQHIEVLVAVPESRMTQLKLGDEVVVKLWADKNKIYTGKVREIAPAANSATRAFDVRISVLNADQSFKLGMTAGVSFGENVADEIIIPAPALTQVQGKTSVWVISKDGIANPREVTSGQYTETGVVVSNGLKVGEMVAIAGVHTLVKGQKVRPQVEVAP